MLDYIETNTIYYDGCDEDDDHPGGWVLVTRSAHNLKK